MLKKVILCVIDSFHPQVLAECFSRGWVPALQFLRDEGYYHNDCVSVFPTMTPTAAAAISTGRHPDMHRIPGFIWYDETNKRIVNYGATPMAIYRVGVRTVLEELIYNLNLKHLNAKIPTVFETLSQHGISTGCINFFIHRGTTEYKTKIPVTMQMLSKFNWQQQTISGPDQLVLGKVVCPAWLDQAGAPAAPWNKYGINDLFSGYALKEMVRQNKLPQFTLAYFPDTDAMAHDHGPLDTHKSIRRVDKQIAAILDLYENWHKALDELAFIIVGDHSQTLIGRTRNHLINLQAMLSEFKQLRLGFVLTDEQLVISPNERMAILDFPDAQIKDDVVKRLVKEYRITQIVWKEADEYRVLKGGTGQKLSFRQGGSYWDRSGMSWAWSGDLGVLDYRIQGRQLIDGDYPDAFYRIKTAMDGCPRGLLLSAFPGYEFRGEHAPLHPGGGSHGSLHKKDSVVPLIIAGLDKDIPNPRITSFVPYVTDYFGISDLPNPKSTHILG